ncbi:ORF6C domain-containing protein [Clostridium perfringens]|jgi:prophage antirepressor-like protein|uniref:BRO domain-containing protein n=1 Tax=Clostridium perfringens F262 TaxID=883064 RepID=A0AAV3FC72_CLOPF|nr:ORF6C domain-containing protein [Clostridium perfringens]EHK2349150.1 ORF6C domain-containing protein [Clostridium perfringens]EIA17040.1 BRO domain-containing protein [Clostridium perfringens F262]MDM0834538.1 ORF6C domain-containing protein [Clostridium perfringens]MDM0843250.1 ORF6C domain-containing protein [Clostridium perfringens]MDU2433679.1 ORF6C domain-containing protein [Clostridium perfringens]
MNNLMIFENKELGMDVRAIKNKDGSISINAEDTARGFGFTQIKNKKEYVRWETLNTYCKEFGFSQQVGKDDFIPESLFYLLGMKANNDVARKFQTWLAIDVIPAVRKTGQYKTQNKELLSSIDMFELQVKALREVEEKVNEVDKKFDDLPLFEIDSKDLKKKVNRVVVSLLGGKKSNAYKPLSKKVFSDLYGQIHREFGVNTCAAIKRRDLDLAKEIVDNYTLPRALKEEIELANSQLAFA